PTCRCPEPALHLAPAGGGGGADGRRQRRTGGAGVGLSGFAEPGARAATAARQEDAGSRDPQGGARTRHGVKKTAAAGAVAAEGRVAMKSVAGGIRGSPPNFVERMDERAKKRIGRPPLPDDKLVAEIKAVIAELPTYGYRRVHAILKRQALAAGLKPPNHKRVYRVMKVHGLLLDRHAGGVERRHDGRIAVDKRNRPWCSDGFEIGCGNRERVRVAFVLDCCDREAMSFLATTSGVSGEDVRDLMLAAVEHRFGPVNRLPIEWLSDNGSCYLAGETRSFARDIGLEPRTTPIESPQ